MEIPYIKYYVPGAMGWGYRPLRPTGRWKFVRGPYNVINTLYIEHKGRMFRQWVHEAEIEFRPAEKEVIFNCTKEQP